VHNVNILEKFLFFFKSEIFVVQRDFFISVVLKLIQLFKVIFGVIP
jgi:hypothetical protein